MKSKILRVAGRVLSNCADAGIWVMLHLRRLARSMGGNRSMSVSFRKILLFELLELAKEIQRLHWENQRD